VFPHGPEPNRFVVAHDESGDVSTLSYFASGFIYAPEHAVDPIVGRLHAARELHDYHAEIHFNTLRNGPGRHFGAKAAVARDWLNALPELTVLGLRAYVFVVNRSAQGFDGLRMPKPRHFAYNRYTRMGMESSLIWLFKGRSIELRAISDRKHRARRAGDDQFADGDNFAEYLPRAVAWRVNNAGGAWPTVQFTPPTVEMIDTSAAVGTNEGELVQLVDILTSASRSAISGERGRKPGKECVAEVAAEIVRDLAEKSWDQRLGLHRRVAFAEFQGDRFEDPVLPRRVAAAQIEFPLQRPS